MTVEPQEVPAFVGTFADRYLDVFDARPWLRTAPAIRIVQALQDNPYPQNPPSVEETNMDMLAGSGLNAPGPTDRWPFCRVTPDGPAMLTWLAGHWPHETTIAALYPSDWPHGTSLGQVLSAAATDPTLLLQALHCLGAPGRRDPALAIRVLRPALEQTVAVVGEQARLVDLERAVGFLGAGVPLVWALRYLSAGVGVTEAAGYEAAGASRPDLDVLALLAALQPPVS